MDPIFQTYLSHLLPLNLRTILGPGLASLFHVVGPQIPDFWCWRWWRPDVVFSRVFHISQLGSFQRYLSFLSFLHSFHSYIFSLQSVLFSYHSFFFRFLRPSSLEKTKSWLHGSRIFCTSNGREHKIWVDTNRLLHRWLGRCSSLSSRAHRRNAFFTSLGVSPIRKQGPKNTTKSPQSYSTEFDLHTTHCKKPWDATK